ncbi:GNAT family N-acetyltransferase [Salinigranum rubrum]|uniref:GNAT family N-acetyltransferase n=1 Tax=Salinigranum rubrum TaxID=755307 RepID=A0A2I8VQL4_9EURY|nr:GNAT family N-acetyltransferase [Salinigranum rubrum]AUV83419.1 GNAT family N-acetyltransferase [Salinigranum rubrum]
MTGNEPILGDDGPDVRVRQAREGDILAVLRVVEGAMLEVGANQVRRRTESGGVLVAERGGRVVGALVRDGEHVEAIAVHPQQRGSGVGSRLIERVLEEMGRVTAEFRAEVRPFYESLGFDIEERAGEKRLWGERER